MTKKKRIFIVLAIIAALAVAFCLWYTRPRTFDDLLDGRTVTDLAAAGIFMDNVNGKMESHSYSLSQTEQSKEAAQGFAEILSGSRYRASLRSFFPMPTSFDSFGPFSISGVVILDDGSDLFITVLGPTVLFSGDGFPSIASADKDLAQRLFDYLAEHGVSGSAEE